MGVINHSSLDRNEGTRVTWGVNGGVLKIDLLPQMYELWVWISQFVEIFKIKDKALNLSSELYTSPQTLHIFNKKNNLQLDESLVRNCTLTYI